MANMDWDDYLRHEALIYRQLAEETENGLGKQEFLDLAAVCEEVANNIGSSDRWVRRRIHTTVQAPILNARSP
jgi:hypothetical protein